MINWEEPMKIDEWSKTIRDFNYEILKFALFTYDQPLKDHMVFMNHFKILVILKGKYKVKVDDHTFELGQGAIMMVAPNTYYTVSADPLDDELAFYTLHFKVVPYRKEKEFLEFFQLNRLMIFRHYDNPNRLGLMDQVYRYVSVSQDGYYLKTFLLLITILLDIKLVLNDESQIIKPKRHVKSSEEEVVGQCLDYIHTHYNEQVKVEDLCSLCSVSQSYLYRCFKKLLGKSTSQFILEQKMIKAQELLQTTDNSITSISEEVGFSSIYLFSSTFKNMVGVSPKQYRQRKQIKG